MKLGVSTKDVTRPVLTGVGFYGAGMAHGRLYDVIGNGGATAAIVGAGFLMSKVKGLRTVGNGFLTQAVVGGLAYAANKIRMASISTPGGA